MSSMFILVARSYCYSEDSEPKSETQKDKRLELLYNLKGDFITGLNEYGPTDQTGIQH